MLSKISIRTETKSDFGSTNDIIKLSCKSESYIQVTDCKSISQFRKSSDFIPELSIVAEYNCTVVGHIFFSKIIIKDNDFEHESLSLSQLSVHPSFPNLGIDRALMNEGHKTALKLGFNSSIVIGGNSNYYAGFNYKPCSLYYIKPPFDLINDNFFLASELINNSLANVSGTVFFPPEFNL